MKKPTKASIAKVKKELDKTGKSSININYKIWTYPKYQVQHFENQICVWDEESSINILKRKEGDGVQITFTRKPLSNITEKPTCIYRLNEKNLIETILAVKNSSIDKLIFALEEYKRWKAVKEAGWKKSKLYKAEYKIPVKKSAKKAVKPVVKRKPKKK